MELPQQTQKMVTVMPQHKKIQENLHIQKHKSSHKLNVSDYVVEKKKQLSKKLSQKFGDLIFDINQKNKSNKKESYVRRGSFVTRPKIKKELLKEYKEQLRIEKKYRKLQIIQNLYDSSEDESEKEEQNVSAELYIDSESYFILIFDILIVFFTFYILFFIPLKLAERKNYIIEEKTIFIVFNIITEVLYILDLIICFFRTFYNYEYKKMTRINEIILNYLTNDFFFDLIEAFPSYIICKNFCYKNVDINSELSAFEIAMTIFQIVKVLKILKVLNIKGNRAFELLHEKIGENYFFENLFNLFTFVFKIFSFLHILICIHIFLGWQSYPNWMIHINIINEPLRIKYISSFYFIIETMTTVGYGDIICISFIERCFQLILLSIGIVSYSFIITKFGNYIMKKSKEEIELDKKMAQLEQVRIQYPLMPYKLYMKIQGYFRKKSEKHSNKNEMTHLVNNLPDKLRNDMLLVIYRDVINNFYIFKNCKNTDFITQMCAAFVHVTCEKETILLMEGKKVENIIFVKEGRLILEAAINLNNPSESYEKYFRKNFQEINMKTFQKMRNSVSQAEGSAIDYKQLENNNYLNYLEEKLLDNNKIGKKGNSFFDVTKNSISFQVGYESDDQDKDKNKDKDNENSDIFREGSNYKYLKILDIRKNEHFGDFFLFDEKPAPLTLKVKSKVAKIFILKKKDAMAINDIHHNIMNRIRQKSFKNLISIKNKTISILKQYIGNKLSKFKRTQLQNTSWFNEKSRNNINVLQDISNFLNNSINNFEKGEFSPNSPLNATTNRKSILKDLITAKTPKKKSILDKNNVSFKGTNTLNTPKSNYNNYKFKKVHAGYRKSNETEFRAVSSKNNLLNLNYEPKIFVKNKLKNKSFSLKTNLDDVKLNIEKSEAIQKSHKNLNNKNITKGIFSKKSNSIRSNNTKKKVKFKCDYQETESLYKSLKESSLEASSIQEEITSEITKPEERITTLNDIYSQGESIVRKKIKSSVKKEKILKLCKTQKNMIESLKQKLNEKSNFNSEDSSNNNSNENEENEDLKKIIELNNMIYNKLLEYLDNEIVTDIEGDTQEINNKEFVIEKTINFNIKSSYSNLNNLTKGKIIINNNYKIDIKNLVQNYIKEKNKNSMNSLDYLVKNYYKDYQDQSHDQTFNISSPKKRKKSKFKIHSSKNLKALIQKQETATKILSHQIKKTITNKIEAFKNYKNADFDDKLSHMKLNIGKTGSNSLSKYNSNKNNFVETKSNNENGFTKFINSIFAKFKGK